MDYPEYERSQELACAGDHVPAFMQAIFEGAGSDPTLASLMRRIYKDTDAGISVSFQLDDGTYVYADHREQAKDPSLVNRVRCIGFSSIVEGSDREVPLQWLDLLGERWDTPEAVVSEFDRLVKETNDEACRIWDEEHAVPSVDEMLERSHIGGHFHRWGVEGGSIRVTRDELSAALKDAYDPEDPDWMLQVQLNNAD